MMLFLVHSVRGISAREFIDLFFEPDIKTEWDGWFYFYHRFAKG